MLQLKNTTRFTAGIALFPDEQGVDALYVMVKASFDIGAVPTLADEQAPLCAGDVYWGEPGESSVRWPGDYHTGKPATDIIMVGEAVPPGGAEATRLDVGLTVGEVGKSVRVFGDRQWQRGRISAPTPFTSMPLVYERAFGGVLEADGEAVDAESRNPVGCGFAIARTGEARDGLPLPNLEDPAALIAAPTDSPAPACFGAVAPAWEPRARLAGTYDERWRSERAPYLPEDFDPRFLNAAHPDLIYPGYLQGGERVEITHMHPSGTLVFEVPRVRLNVRVTIDGREESPPLALETLLLEPNALRASLGWRAVVPCDKQALRISEVRVSLAR